MIQKDIVAGACENVVERVFEHRVRQQVERDDMQFGFMNGERTTDAVFVIR